MHILNPWHWFYRAMLAICSRRAAFWFVAGHPYWDCRRGVAQEWSVAKYGERPQDVFYQRWESRRQLWASRAGMDAMRLEDAERLAVRKQYDF